MQYYQILLNNSQFFIGVQKYIFFSFLKMYKIYYTFKPSNIWFIRQIMYYLEMRKKVRVWRRLCKCQFYRVIDFILKTPLDYNLVVCGANSQNKNDFKTTQLVKKLTNSIIVYQKPTKNPLFVCKYFLWDRSIWRKISKERWFLIIFFHF